MAKIHHIKFSASKSSGEVSGIINIPDNSAAFLVFAHGAGAPMNHPFMNIMAEALSTQGIGTLRFNFPYTEKKNKRIDPVPVLHETIRNAVSEAKKYAGSMSLFAGGKSMGGRMTSQAESATHIEGVKGLIFFGFPLHAPGKESTERAEHLFSVKVPMLFLQGTRDKLARLDLLNPIIKKVGKYAEIKVIDGADHSFHLLKSSGRTDNDVIFEIATKVRQFCNQSASERVF